MCGCRIEGGKVFSRLVGLLLDDLVNQEVEDPLGDPGRVDLVVGSLVLSLWSRDVHRVLLGWL